MKKPSKKTLRKKCDKLWSSIIRKKNNGCCEICQKIGNQPHHVVGRKNLTLRYDLRNGCLLGYTHHVGGKESAHNDPIWFLEWFKKARPKDYAYLKKKKNILSPNFDYEKTLKRLNRQANKI